MEWLEAVAVPLDGDNFARRIKRVSVLHLLSSEQLLALWEDPVKEDTRNKQLIHSQWTTKRLLESRLVGQRNTPIGMQDLRRIAELLLITPEMNT